jgi:hypothetical protein
MSKLDKENPKQLLVEGNDDLHVISNIWKNVTKDETPPFYIRDCKSIDNIVPVLAAFLQNPVKTEIIGIVLDADFTPKAHWQSVRNELLKTGYSLPEQPDINGTIIEKHGLYPRIGIWLMPDNSTTGMLEDFVKYLVPENDKLWAESERVLAEIENQNLHQYNEKIQRSKAQIHTWLAWQKEPGKPMGIAIQSNFLTTHHDLCQRFTTWLNNLFNSNHSDTSTFTQ